MSVATVSPILNNIDNLVGYLKRARGLDYSDYSDLELIDHRAKRLKAETDVDETPLRFGYIPKGLVVSSDEIDRIRNQNTRNLLLNHKKLHLVLDLDHTLLNSTCLDDLSPDEEYLKTQTQADHSLQYVSIVETPSMRLMTKLRPYIRTFLHQASQMFEVSVYTMGSRDYALEMAKLLDPANLIFGGRIISRSDSTERDRKSLDVLLARESNVVIIDDKKDVWATDNQENVIYGGAYLASVLQLLRHIHILFFNEVESQDLVDRDVRPVLQILKKQVLNGCKIVFSHVFPLSVEASTHPLWKMAEQLGATCSTEFDADVTHVIAANTRTQKSIRAVREGKLLVTPQWIHITNIMWQRQPENNFPCH
uniref:RNA polymerase II C-terminal domain phosphatase-like 4 n=1 Tax=Fragaria vesca subsp. vesca TaxID=101020 RepID=UPI0005C8E167|nr:PREDICTED: RNA polymerase II C-terminal domain phosphatase-like 4 [Fragaria vesca subsp. vesca]